MADKYHRYEAAVKLSNDRVVVYHNINTGLWKFHRFLCEKFSGSVCWLYYSVRRKSNKEVIGKFRNAVPDRELACVNVFSRFEPHWGGKGIYLSIPVRYGRNEVVRNKFISYKNVLHSNSLMVTIPEWLFKKIVEEAREELLEYYSQKGHQLVLDDLCPGDITFTMEKTLIKGREMEMPEQDYP